MVRGTVARLLVFVLGVVLFVIGWWRAASSGDIDLWFIAWLALGVVATVLVTLVWIRWNRRIYRRKGPRRATADPGPLPARDQLGRPVIVVAGSLEAHATRLTLVDDVVEICPDGAQ